MSAVKLEKTVVKLELRLKEELAQHEREMRRRFAEFSARLLAVEAKLGGFERVDKEPHLEEPEDIDDIVEEYLDGEAKSPERTEILQMEEVAPSNTKVWPWAKEEEPEVPEAEEVEEPVAFMETAWNLVLVLGQTKTGWADALIACLLLLSSAGMQIIFSAILLTKEFLGEPFHDQIDIAKEWRRSVAHDFKHIDLAQTSLVSRVCNGDGKLILSTDQASLLGQIDAFLNLGHGDFELPWLQPGILLCMLCILLWCLYLCQELRAVFFSLEAVSLLPRGAKTIMQGGRFIQMSYHRWAAYCLMRLARLGIAVTLLYAGVLWLAGTTSITDLILNAVALSAILQVDEMVFAALMPKRIQINIQDLEAIKVRYSNLRSQLESVVLLVLVAGLMIWPYLLYVGPLANDMLEVKRAYCYGEQDFVVASNDQQQVVMGYRTNPFGLNKAESLSQFAVSSWIGASKKDVSRYILFHQTLGEFQRWRAMAMGDFASADQNCWNWDQRFLDPSVDRSSWEETYRTHWYSTAWSLDMPLESNCSDMKHRCDDIGSDLLRFTCGVECGCDDSFSNPMWRVSQKGCTFQCVHSARESTVAYACEDADVTSGPLKESWRSFWSGFMDAALFVAGINLRDDPGWSYWLHRFQNLSDQGCAALRNVGWGDELIFHSNFCQGHEQLYRPLAYLCPVSCGCAELEPLPDHCPRSCEGCVDTRNFPVQGTITNCQQGRDAGLCAAFPDQALDLCPKTCDLCHLISNRTRSQAPIGPV